MTPAFVLDTSLTLSWCFKDETTPANAAVLARLDNSATLVPGLWFLEVANALVVGERRGRLSQDEIFGFLSLLSALDVIVDPPLDRKAYERLSPLCRRHRLTAYDGVYLELALRTGLPLATLDAELITAARASGVVVIGGAGEQEPAP